MRIFKARQQQQQQSAATQSPPSSGPTALSSSQPPSATSPSSPLPNLSAGGGSVWIPEEWDEEGREVLVNLHTINQKDYFERLLKQGSDFTMDGKGDPVLAQLAVIGDEYVHCASMEPLEDVVQHYDRFAEVGKTEEVTTALPPVVDDSDDDTFSDLSESEEKIFSGDGREKLVVLTRQSLIQMAKPAEKPAIKDVTSPEVLEYLKTAGVFEGPRAEWRISHSRIHSIEPSVENDRVFHVFYYPKAKSRGNFELSRMSLSCASSMERDEWIIIFGRILQDFWQLLFEARTIPAPEIYQFHLFMRKINRKGKEQIRLLILSNSKLYNVKYKPGDSDPKKSVTRWVLPLETLLKIKKYTLSPTSFGLVFDKKRAVKMVKNLKNMHEEYAYVCKDVRERNKVISELKRCYNLITNNVLEVVELDSGAGKSKG